MFILLQLDEPSYQSHPFSITLCFCVKVSVRNAFGLMF
jgi:hypothetical protein